MSHVVVSQHPLVFGEPPVWASDWGCDRIGPWCQLSVGDVGQKMRWVPAGQFLMGSPDDEKDRDSDEGPQHWVTISRGFWMFDTPCTQSLWEAVMGKNPSHFKGGSRPVEQVSWFDCLDFVAKLNGDIPDLNLRLPSESEWEYACRSGEPTARYGELEQVAWHRGNSGRETHAVGGKSSNAFGLFDMLGNVFEWCNDNAYRQYSDASIIDPWYVGPDEASERVVRGGDWIHRVRFVRAADRVSLHASFRSHYVGFRCLSSA